MKNLFIFALAMLSITTYAKDRIDINLQDEVEACHNSATLEVSDSLKGVYSVNGVNFLRVGDSGIETIFQQNERLVERYISDYCVKNGLKTKKNGDVILLSAKIKRSSGVAPFLYSSDYRKIVIKHTRSTGLFEYRVGIGGFAVGGIIFFGGSHSKGKYKPIDFQPLYESDSDLNSKSLGK